MAGIFYGVGVGPGDPALLTEKAKRCIDMADVLAVPVNGKAATAFSIVKQAVDLKEKPVLELEFSMSGDRQAWKACAVQAAEAIGALLEEGRQVALVTLGDVTLYSTCMYVFQLLKRQGFAAELVPGISAASAGAALAGISLARDQESVAVVPLGRNPEKYRALLDAADNLVLMKAGHCMPWIVQYMKEHGILPEQAVVFADLGLPGEYVGAPEADRDYGYFTTVIVNKKYDRT